MAHPNEELLRGGYEAFARGDLDAVRSLFSEDIAWHIPGRTPMSGDYRGHDEVFGFFGQVFELSGGTFSVEVHDILANDDHAVALVTEHAERPGRGTLDAKEAHVWHLAGGKATEFWGAPFDLHATEAFWS